MSTTLWIGLGFLTVLVIFLMITYFAKDNSTRAQLNTLRFLTSLCAGFSGGFLMGEALFKLGADLGGGATISISGTAGFALFFTIWFTYSRYLMPPNGETPPPPVEESFSLSIPENWTFKVTVDRIVNSVGGNYEFKGFTEEQLNLVVRSEALETPSAKDAIIRLKYLCSDLPEYKVTEESNIFIIEKV